MFDVTKCDFCGECLERCAYMDFDIKSGADAFGKLFRDGQADWVKKCITCFACNEFCTKSARPFDLILEHMEKRGDYVSSRIFTALVDRFTPKEEFRPPQVKSRRVLSMCTIEGALPRKAEGLLFEGLMIVKGRHFFCNVIFPHLGNESRMREGLKPLVDRYAALGCDEVIFFHDDCYTLMAEIAPQYGVELPFEPIHIFEFLRDRLREKKEAIRLLNMRVAYQRPCASRLTPWKESILEEVFRMIGVSRVQRKYDRENALCCGQDLKGIMKRGDRFPAFQDLNIRDAKDSEAQAMVFLCPMCLDALGAKCKEAGLETHMVADLCRLAIGEE